MDCEKGFIEAYGSKATQNAALFKRQSQEIEDADLLASEIFLSGDTSLIGQTESHV